MIHVFETKYASNPFLHAFVNKYDNIKYRNVETGVGEEFYRNIWPNFNPQKLNDGDEIAFQGIIRNTHFFKKHFDKHNWYYFDQPYFFATHYKKHSDFNDIWYRITKNNTQKNYVDKDYRHEKRFKEIYSKTTKEIKLQRWRKTGEHVLVIPPSYHTARWYNLDRHEWEKNIVKELKKYTDREVRVRHKFIDNANFGTRAHKPLKKDLENCWAIVSWHSMCASEAIVQGIPSFSSQHSPAFPVSYSLQELNKIEQPKMLDREQWLYSLIGSQFTLSEMQSGFAYKYINEE